MAEDTQNPARDLHSLWTQNEQRFKRSRELITEVGKWERQEIKPQLPTRMQNGREVQQGFPVQLPHATTMALDVSAFVARRQPSLKRKPLGEGTRAQRDASKVERWLQEAFASKIRIDGDPLWETIVSFGVHDGEYAIICQPSASHYGGHLRLMDDDGQIEARWIRNSNGEDLAEFREKHPRAEYRVSEGRSSAAYSSYLRDWKARRWPFSIRVLSAQEYLPIGRDPLSSKLDTLLIRSVCSATHLKAQGFEWWAHTAGGADDANIEGSGQVYWLYELHSSNPWRIVYQIVGMDGQQYQSTLKDGMPDQCGIDCGERYGIQRLPAAVYYGWHRPQEKDPDKRGIPLLAPFIGIIGAANRSVTGIIEHNFRTGFGGWGVKMEKDLYEVWVEMGRPTQFDLQDDSIHVLLGDPTSLVHQGVGSDSWRILEFLTALVERFNESERVRTSADASSIAQTTQAASSDTILGQISGGCLEAYRFVAECLLEQCSVLSQEMGAPIPVYCTLNREGEEQTHVELSAEQIMGDYTVEVAQPQRKGQNLARAQAGTAWRESNLISTYTWLQDFYGEEQPEEEMDRVAAEQYIASEQGQQELALMVARIQGDRTRLQITGLQEAGKLSEGGMPTAALPPQPPANGVAPNGVPMPINVNPAASALGGITAAAVNPGAVAGVVQATGTGPEMAMP